MKIKQEHYNELKNLTLKVKNGVTDEQVQLAKQALAENEKVKDKAVAWLWNVYHIANKFSKKELETHNTYISDELYSYLNDSHIETAMKSILKEIAFQF